MRKSEKIIAALLIVALGILLIVLKDNFIGIVMTIAGVGLILFGVADIFEGEIPLAAVKIISGIFVVGCGWTVVSALLYVIAVALLVFGVILLYRRIKDREWNCTLLDNVCNYAAPVICILIGGLLLFHNCKAVTAILIACGVLTVIEGAILLFDAFRESSYR